MKKLIILLFFCVSHSAFAQNVTLNFNAMSVSELSTTFFSGILKKDFVISPDLLSDNRKITLNIKDIEPKNLYTTIKTILERQGVSVSLEKNIYYLDILKIQPLPTFLEQNNNHQALPIEKNIPQINLDLPVHLYKPKFRQTKELAQILALFNINTHVKDTDFLLYQTTQDNALKIDQLLIKLDTPTVQYEVVSATYEVSKTDDKQRSIDIIGDIFKNLSINIVTTGASNLIKFNGGSLTSAFKFFDSDSRFKSISKPYARVKSGGKLQFTSGQDVPTLANITTTNNQTQQGIEYRKSGVILDVELNAVSDAIDIKINHELSNFVQTKTGINNSPTLNKRALKTDLTVNDGEIIVIGGLTDFSTSKTNMSFFGLFPLEKISNERQIETYIFLQVTKI